MVAIFQCDLFHTHLNISVFEAYVAFTCLSIEAQKPHVFFKNKMRPINDIYNS